MSDANQDRLTQLRTLAAKEQDPEKLMTVLREIVQLISVPDATRNFQSPTQRGPAR